jgi:hypothetical protein
MYNYCVSVKNVLIKFKKKKEQEDYDTNGGELVVFREGGIQASDGLCQEGPECGELGEEPLGKGLRPWDSRCVRATRLPLSSLEKTSLLGCRGMAWASLAWVPGCNLGLG